MKIIFSTAAAEDITLIVEYIQIVLKNLSASVKAKNKILSAIDLLSDNPELGVLLSPVDKQLNIKMLVVDSYLVFYQVTNQIKVIRIRDSRTDELFDFIDML
jgi:plasmid stabilization system protein ParE